MTLLSTIDSARVHDLVRIDTESISHISAPSWVKATIFVCPWAVVRRVPSLAGEVAIGVRGSSRDKRWGGHIRKDFINTHLRPMDILARYISTAGVSRTPAIGALEQVVQTWQDFRLPWGPTGSVALELVSGQPVTTESSDLDIAIEAQSRLSLDTARALWRHVVNLRPKIDIRVETPECGFSLQEYVYSAPSRIFLRYSDGVRLGSDPWCGSNGGNDYRVINVVRICG